ncbi:hypothetical protein ACFFLZ_07135 [Photobacterium aphoticum]|uniref:hypothetical protein n=1 Tax=Photobacterium aphoticum TaxID=754436 RepID=UPI0011B228AC|nr:hypothetical protein [Photobacterium aphoticum]GHA49188.1 hypothetical protein GCM10007086_23670 [Photobacterium aphoticum]
MSTVTSPALVNVFVTTALPTPASFSQHLAESASFDRFYAQSHPDTAMVVDTSGDEELVWDFGDQLSTNYPTQEQSQSNQHSTETRSLDPMLTGASRMATLFRHDSDEAEPLYLLAIELPIPPAPSFAKDYRVEFHPNVDWMCNVVPASNRISGWKDSNLLYTLYHQHVSHV